MALIKNVRNEFPRALKLRGEALFKSNRVEFVEAKGMAVLFNVTDHETFRVQLARSENCLSGICACPNFDMEGNCQHIWAGLLAADKLGSLDVPGAEPPYFFAPEEDPHTFAAKFKEPARTKATPKASPKESKKKTARAKWKTALDEVAQPQHRFSTGTDSRAHFWPLDQQLIYIIHLGRLKHVDDPLPLQLAVRSLLPDGEWSVPKPKSFDSALAASLPDAEDRALVGSLAGATREFQFEKKDAFGEQGASEYRLSSALTENLLPRICNTGRAFLCKQEKSLRVLEPLHWEKDPWTFEITAEIDQNQAKKESGSEGVFILKARLRRGDEHKEVTAPECLHPDGLVFWSSSVSPLNCGKAFHWLALFRKRPEIPVPVAERTAFLSEFFKHPVLPALDFSKDLALAVKGIAPKPRLLLDEPVGPEYRGKIVAGSVQYEYEDTDMPLRDRRGYLLLKDGKRWCERDWMAERAREAELEKAGFKELEEADRSTPGFQIPVRKFASSVEKLLSRGWYVQAKGKPYHPSGEFDIQITSGIDWFDLQGSVKFGDYEVPLPDILNAIKKGERVVRLGDGSYGMLPEQWLQKFGLLIGLGKEKDDGLRFGKNQTLMLEAFLAEAPNAVCDQDFSKRREELKSFDGIKPKKAPATFVGALRPYQSLGLGWFDFLNCFGFGGCLADDMGLGKTVQVLALLEQRREDRQAGKLEEDTPRSSLVVVPKSIVFNWKEEAGRFAPGLKVLDHTGPGRDPKGTAFGNYDMVLTTYGTLRNDVESLRLIAFDYVILDESQAIKNPQSNAAKAVRLLKRRHALAMTGTPVENHLGELWSQFEFLNPGMLGSSKAFKGLIPSGDQIDPETQATDNEPLARALRPFILRRTKRQVAPELPEKIEQTVRCDLPDEQQKVYTELKTYYQKSLLDRVAGVGIKQSKIQILEALLRLRQAACHVGLLDEAKADVPSGKLDVLLPRIKEVVEEGHKTLVFSQFTSFLAIVRRHLDAEGIEYAYLDGKTKKRNLVVEQFQTDPNCPLFLISLKAGGVGLNLTAAQYVFLLDPWWNPAVEAQAIDRTHRIGQTENVIACRLIARGTVEEKVLELQNRKRALADSILKAEGSLIRELKQEDLELLLS